MFLFQTNHVVNKQCEYGVHVTNSYIHAKFERVLLDVHRDIHHFLNVIYYSWVDDVKMHLICMFWKPKYIGNKTRYRETENAIESYLQMLVFHN